MRNLYLLGSDLLPVHLRYSLAIRLFHQQVQTFLHFQSLLAYFDCVFGCKVADEAERLAIERVKELYGCEYANVQPHSGG